MSKTSFWGFKNPAGEWASIPTPEGDAVLVFSSKDLAVAHAGRFAGDDPRGRRVIAGWVQRLKKNSLERDDLVMPDVAAAAPDKIAGATITWRDLRREGKTMLGIKPKKLPLQTFDADTGKPVEVSLGEGEVVVLMNLEKRTPITIRDHEDEIALPVFTSQEEVRLMLESLQGKGMTPLTSDGAAIGGTHAPLSEVVEHEKKAGIADYIGINMGRERYQVLRMKGERQEASHEEEQEALRQNPEFLRAAGFTIEEMTYAWVGTFEDGVHLPLDYGEEEVEMPVPVPAKLLTHGITGDEEGTGMIELFHSPHSDRFAVVATMWKPAIEHEKCPPTPVGKLPPNGGAPLKKLEDGSVVWDAEGVPPPHVCVAYPRQKDDWFTAEELKETFPMFAQVVDERKGK